MNFRHGWIDQTNLQIFLRHLRRQTFRGAQEHIVGHALGFRGVHGQTNRRINVNIVSLPWHKKFPLIVQRRKWTARGKNGAALRMLNGVLSGALTLACGIGIRKQNWPRI